MFIGPTWLIPSMQVSSGADSLKVSDLVFVLFCFVFSKKKKNRNSIFYGQIWMNNAFTGSSMTCIGPVVIQMASCDLRKKNTKMSTLCAESKQVSYLITWKFIVCAIYPQ